MVFLLGSINAPTGTIGKLMVGPYLPFEGLKPKIDVIAYILILLILIKDLLGEDKLARIRTNCAFRGLKMAYQTAASVSF